MALLGALGLPLAGGILQTAFGAPDDSQKRLRGELFRLLQQQAQGKGPSPAAEMLRQHALRIGSQQRALAASAAPSQGALAQLLAQQQGGQAQAQVAGQAAQARLEEQLRARQALLAALLQQQQIDAQKPSAFDRFLSGTQAGASAFRFLG